MAFILDGNRRGLAALLLIAIVIAVCEAFLLTALVQGATALGRRSGSITLDLGPKTLTVNVTAYLAVALLAAIIRAAFSAWSAMLGPRVTGASRERHRRRLLEAYLYSDWSAQAADRTGRLQQVFSTSINEVNAVVLTVTTAMTALITLVVLLVVAFVLSPPITGVLLISGFFIYLVLRPLSRGSRRAALVDAETRIASASHVAVIAAAGAEIAVLGTTDAVVARGRHLIGRAERAFALSNGLRTLANTSLQSLAFIVAAGGLVAVSLFNLPVDFTVLGAIALLLLRAAGFANQVQQAFGLFGQMSPFVSQVRELTAHFRSRSRTFGTEFFPHDYTITIRDLEYVYPGSARSVLTIPHLSIAPGSAMAVVGPSGSGKSTLIQLLLRLRSPTVGRMDVGSIPALSIGESEFARNVAFVPQAPHLIPGTVRENIRFFRDWIEDAQIEACARLAHIHNEIVAMPCGYETMLDSHVDMLSGGQKQRLSLARALASEPAILVLDEPTSALDATNEKLVTQTLADMRQRCTVIIITHRESTISHCDTVVALNDGALLIRQV